MKWGAAPRNHLSLSLTLPLYQFPSLCLSLSLSPFLACTLPHSVSLPASRSQTHRQMQTHTHTHTLFLSLHRLSLYLFPLLSCPLFSLIQTHTYSLLSVCLSLYNLTPPHPFSLSSLHWLELHRGTLILPVQKGHHHQRQGTSTESPKSQSFLQRMTRM